MAPSVQRAETVTKNYVVTKTGKAAHCAISTSNFLDALNGLAYVASRSGELLAFGGRNWNTFACQNIGQEALSDNLLGRNLFDFIQGEKVRDVYQSSHATLLADDRARVTFEYRCDAPDKRLHMFMAISPIVCDDGTTAILYQSQLLCERVRVPLPILFSNKTCTTDQVISVCSFCAMIAWPGGDSSANEEWVSAENYYTRGGSSLVRVSHGICPACFSKSQNQWRL